MHMQHDIIPTAGISVGLALNNMVSDYAGLAQITCYPLGMPAHGFIVA